MSDDTDRFMQAIAAFSASPEPIGVEGRKIAETTDTVLQAFLTEINETVLRRILHFTNSQGERLVVDVSERRIRRVLALPERNAGDHTDLLNKDLTDQDGSAVLALLRAFKQDSNLLFARASLADPEVKANINGLSIRELQTVSQQLETSNGAPAASLHLIRAVFDEADASFLQSGSNAPVRHGNKPMLDALEEVVRLQDQSGNSGGSQVSLWQVNAFADSAVMIAQLNGTFLACVMPMQRALTHFNTLAERTRASSADADLS